MYTDYFGLKREPFSIAPDPRYLFMSDRHREALAHLLYGVNGGGGFVLLTGEIGAGKTTVCRAFLEQVPSQSHVAYIFNPKLNAMELLQTVCEEFHIPLPAPTSTDGSGWGLKAYFDAINKHLLETHARGENSVVIVDEAQNLTPDVLEQLRLLTNLETNERKLLQIILIGQPELRDLLAHPDMEQMAQRVIARYHLDALSPSETAQYIAHRLAVAGWQGGPLFDAKAVVRIHEITRGVPRRINVLCDRALLGTYGSNQRSVSLDITNKAAAEIYDSLTKESAKPLRSIALNPTASAARIPAWFWGATGGVLLSALLAGAGFLYWRNDAAQQSPDKAPAAALAAATTQVLSTPSVDSNASAPQLAALATPVTPGTSIASLEALNAWLTEAPTKERQAWQALGKLWQLDLPDYAPCTNAAKEGVQCFESKGGLDVIRQLQRPCALGMYDRRGKSVYALLTKLSGDTATLQFRGDADSEPITVSLNDLAKVWRGDFMTLWRTPPGYTQRLEAGSSGDAVTWLAQRLAKWQQQPMPEGQQRYEPALQAKVHTFQITHGMEPDGVAGAMTLMQLNRLTGGDEPVLAVEP